MNIFHTSQLGMVGIKTTVQAGQRYLKLLLLIFLQGIAFQVSAEGTSLDAITYSSMPGDRVQIRMELSNALSQAPLSFTIDNPARLALDFPGTVLGLTEKNKSIGIGMAHSINAVEAGGRTRVVLNLVQMVPYDISMDGSVVLITLENAVATDLAATSMAKPRQGTALPKINNIDFRRGANGEGRVIIELSDPSIAVNIQEEAGQIMVEFANTILPENLNRRLDVVDFATPVKQIDTSVQGNGVRMIITPDGFYEQLAYQSDELLTIEIKPLTEQEQEAQKKEKFSYTGERLSLNFQNIEVRAVLQLIADFTGFNMVASDTVSGNVTLRLKNVPWDQAMDIILRSKGLTMRQAGNVIMVAPQEEVAAREKLELESQQQLEELAPVRTEFIQVNYAKAEDLAALLKAEGNNLLSSRGDVSIDSRTNTLLLQDTADKLVDIRKVIAKLDIPIRQVLIESRIVVANEDFSKELGVRFGYSKITDPESIGTNDLFLAASGTRPGTTSFGGITTGFATGDEEPFLVDLPVTGPAGAVSLAIGKVGTWLLQLELSALQAEGRGEVLSNPRVITANQHEALIEQGTEIPFQEASSSGASTTSFKEAVLSLRVTPQITPDDRIIMDLKVSKDAVGQLFGGIPSIDTQSVETQVLVENGETVVLGGIYEQTNRNDVTKVPFFGDLPYFGFLFKRTSEQKDKSELLIFVTPKILKEGLAVN